MVLVGFDVSHGNLKFETVISSVIKAYRDWMATPPLRPPAPVLISLAIEERAMVGWIFCDPAFYHGQPIMAGNPTLWWLTPGKGRFSCCNANNPRMSSRLLVGRESRRRSSRPCRRGSGRWAGIETGGGGRTMNAQGMRDATAKSGPPSPPKTARHLVFFEPSLRPRPRPAPKSPSGPTTAPHCMAT